MLIITNFRLFSKHLSIFISSQLVLNQNSWAVTLRTNISSPLRRLNWQSTGHRKALLFSPTGIKCVRRVYHYLQITKTGSFQERKKKGQKEIKEAGWPNGRCCLKPSSRALSTSSLAQLSLQPPAVFAGGEGIRVHQFAAHLSAQRICSAKKLYLLPLFTNQEFRSRDWRTCPIHTVVPHAASRSFYPTAQRLKCCRWIQHQFQLWWQHYQDLAWVGPQGRSVLEHCLQRNKLFSLAIAPKESTAPQKREHDPNALWRITKQISVRI